MKVSLLVVLYCLSFLAAGETNLSGGLLGFGKISNASKILFYYRSSQAFEITGNEQSFVGSIHLDLNYQKNWTESSGIEARIDLNVMEPLSLKGRVYDAFNPPSLILNRIDFDVHLNEYHTFTFGISKSPAWTLPFESIFLPVLFHYASLPNGAQPPHALVIGHRDVPFIYTGFLPWYDTGIWYHLKYKGFVLDFGGANGELGLDSNSDKSLQIRFGLDLDNFKSGIAIERGEYGSVPIKEYQHFAKWDLYIGKKEKVLFGLEAMLKASGVKNTNSYVNNIKTDFGYTDGYFDAFSVVNDTGLANPFGLPNNIAFTFSGFIYLGINELLTPQLSLLSHLGVYDPSIFYNILEKQKNVFDEAGAPDDLKAKYRAFLKLTWKWNKDFWMVLSDTYTYDPVFLNRSYNQFYDREDRNGSTPHPLLDNDIYLGFMVNF